MRSGTPRTNPGRRRGGVTGTLIVYEKRAGDRPELFERDAIHWPELGIVINEMHQRNTPVLRVIPFLSLTATNCGLTACCPTRSGAGMRNEHSRRGYVNRCVNDIRRRPSQPLIQWRFHPHTVHRDRRLRSTQGLQTPEALFGDHQHFPDHRYLPDRPSCSAWRHRSEA